MKIYFAAAGGITGMESRDKLESFWYKNDAVEAMRSGAGDFFLDSGAFTAFTKGVTIRPEDYAEFIHRYKATITVASSLDSIGDPVETYRLYRLMRDELDCDVIPVFHCREDFSWLERYIDEGVEYMALGGMVPEAKPWLKKWLDIVWGEYLTHSDGTAKTKVHGFGMTILDFMQDYPWYSVDSSSWTYGARFSYGLIQYPDGGYRWTYFGQNHSSRKDWGSRNYWTFDPTTRTVVDNFVESMGYTVGQFEDTSTLNLFNADVFDSWRGRPLGVFRRDKIQQGLF